MDLRIRKQDGEIDWAMAGERMILSEDPCQYFHLLSVSCISRTNKIYPTYMSPDSSSTLLSMIADWGSEMQMDSHHRLPRLRRPRRGHFRDPG
jgi:hypothetical protein